MRCLTITLNAAVDATYVVNGFVRGGGNRVRRVYRMAGGKGNNVARVLRSLGHTVTASGFLGGHSGALIDAGLTQAGIASRFVWVEAGESRTCHTILDEATAEATEILEPGPEVSDDDRERLLRQIPELVKGTDVVVIAGSAPTGTPTDFLERLAKRAREGAARLVVDSSGPALAALLTGQPDLVKPNAAELAMLMGRAAPLAEQIAFARDDLVACRLAPGARVLISRGEEGAMLVTGSFVYWARPPAIRPVNTVGCGDAMLAGFVDAWLAGLDDARALRQAVAFGAAAALQPVAGVVAQEDVEWIRAGIHVTGEGWESNDEG